MVEKTAQNKKDDKTKNGKLPAVAPLSEEDERKKQELELIVQRMMDPVAGVQKLALEALRSELRATTSSVTSIPKPLKFLKPHYEALTQHYASLSDDHENKKDFADILSVLAMTMSKEGSRDSLKYKLQGHRDEWIREWGHEYMRYLSGEIGEDYQQRANENPNITDADVEDLMGLVDKLVPTMIETASEIDACDLLLEVERLPKIVPFVTKDNARRITQYLRACSKYFLDPENIQVLRVVYDIHRKIDQFAEALIIATMMNDEALVRDTFYSCKDRSVRKQLAFMIGRRHTKITRSEDSMELDDESVDEDFESELAEIMGNNKLSEYFLSLAKELDSLEAKTPEDIYKSHLQDNRPTMGQNIDSARQNLASTFVNAFVNAGSGTDKLMTDEDTKWLYKNRDHGMMSAAASLGMIYMWNVDEGFAEIDKYLYSGDNYIKAGALLALGVCHASIRKEIDVAFAMLSDYISGNSREIRLGSILSLGLAYAGTRHQDCNELLMPILVDPDQPIEVVAFTALALGLIFLGTCNEDISSSIVQVLMERDEKTLMGSSIVRFLSLALGLLFMGKQESADAIIETTRVLNEKIAKYAEQSVSTCAYAGTGNVLKVQELLKICSEHHVEEAKKDEKESAGPAAGGAAGGGMSGLAALLGGAGARPGAGAEKEKKKEEKPELQYQSVASLGIALVALNEDLGEQMAVRSFDHLLQYGDPAVRRTVPLGLALLNISNPQMTVMDTLSKLSHDADTEVAQNAILALGLIGSGTNNARIAQLLRQLSSYYAKEPNILFTVRIAQGLLFTGKGLIGLSPQYCDRMLLDPVSLAGILVVMHSCIDLKNTLLSQYHYLLYSLSLAMYPRMMVTVDEDLQPLATGVRVGMAVDTVTQAGKPRTITGFQTHDTPVLLQHEDRAELATEKYLPLTSVLEGVVVLRKNPDWQDETA